MRVRDDAGAAGRLHFEAVLDGGQRHVGAGSPEDAGEDDRLHLLRAHGDGHENLHYTKTRRVNLLALPSPCRGVANGERTFFFGEDGEETAVAVAESVGAARATERGGGDRSGERR